MTLILSVSLKLEFFGDGDVVTEQEDVESLLESFQRLCSSIGSRHGDQRQVRSLL